jgi:hypothetical protein
MALTEAISPGVYTTLTDLSTYVSVIPGTIGYVPFFSEKGPDRKVVRVSSLKELETIFGKPALKYGQNEYVASEFLKMSGNMYVMRCTVESSTPGDSALFSNVMGILSLMSPTDPVDNDPDSTAYNPWQIKLTNLDEPNNFDIDDLQIQVESDPTDHGLFVLYGKGRGEFYNNVCIQFSNTVTSDPYNNIKRFVLSVYERNPDNNDIDFLESHIVSLDPNDVDLDGESLFIADVVNKYSDLIGCIVNDTGLQTSDLESLYDQVEAIIAGGDATYGLYVRTVAGNADVPVTGYTTTEQGLAIHGVHFYEMVGGSDGDSTYNTGGTIDFNNSDVKNCLIHGYTGDFDDAVINTETTYFTLIFCAEEIHDIKNACAALAIQRDDCIAIVDNGDNANVDDALTVRELTNTWNNYHVAIYEGYSRIYSESEGRNIWISPVVHMAKVFLYSDRVADIWWAAAGYNRGTIDAAKSLRYNPNKTDRDDMYLKQLNPLVKFSDAYVIWGQLTSQMRASAMQDVNIVRLYLYIKKALTNYCKFYIFEQNDAYTWNQVKRDVTDFLTVFVQLRGLETYSVEVGATEYQKKKKEFDVNIMLQPIRTVEKIWLNFTIK